MAVKNPPNDKKPLKLPGSLEDGWGDIRVGAEPLPPVLDGEDGFEFPELDAVLTERAEQDGPGADTGTDLPAAIASPASDLDASEWTSESLPLLDDEPPPLPTADVGSVLDDRAQFAGETQRLARAREWQSLAALTSAALDHSPWARQPETRIALLADLARLYRDRLGDAPSAEDTFRRLLELAPADPEPNRFLAQRYREREDWRALYDLRIGAVDATWNPEQRVEWTRDAARIAAEQLHAEELVIAAWERLWRSGDAEHEAARALSESYRRAGEWERLGEFLVRRADGLAGAERVVVLREAAEAYLTGERNHDRATEVLQQILTALPNDVVALLGLARVHARRRDWAALGELGARRVERKQEQPFLDVRRLAADALWKAGEHDRAVQVYDAILAVAADDADALKAKEEHLSRRGDIEGLVTLLDGRAQATEQPEARAALLERAAQLAAGELGDLRRAAALLERRATIDSGCAETLERLAEIYESLGDHEPVRRVLEERLRLVRNPRDRIELLRRIGEHCAHRLADDVRAEQCWREILDVVPDDRPVREELIALYRRRGDFDAVDRAWSAFAWRPLDDTSLTAIWRAAAVNLLENVSDPARALRAWQRVLDLAPDDATALAATVAQQRALGERALLADALDTRSRTLIDSAGAEARELWLEMARLYEESAQSNAALAAYERVLRSAPTHTAALDACARLYGAEHAAVASGALEVAVAHAEPSARAATVERILALLPAGDALARFSTLRRLLALTGPTPALLHEIDTAGAAAQAFVALAALHEELAAAAHDPAARAAHHQQLALLYETKLGDPVRALLTLTSARQPAPSRLEELAPLLRLAELTQRHEDAFALLGVAAAAEAPPPLRRAAIQLRQQLAEERLADPARAFHQAAWLVRLDPEDPRALADAERLATSAQLWRDLDGLYDELWDRATSTAQRVTLAGKRRDLRAERLADERGALDFTLVLYRLQPGRELFDELCRRAEALGAWERVLPAIEGCMRQPGASSAAELAWLATAHADKRKDARHAFTIDGQAFVADPASTDIESRLTALAAPDETLRLAHRLREGAAHTSDPLRALELYGRVASLYQRAERLDLAGDVHRRILQLDSRARASYEVACAQLRQAGLWRELRDLIEQRVEQDGGADAAAQLERRLEIARVSREHLRDGETALRAYATILEAQPDHEEALAGVRELTDGPIDPALELERLRLELVRAAGARRVELLLQCAALQERELGDAPGAIASLRQIVAESGPGGAGYEPLLALLEGAGAWNDAIDLMEARAAVLSDSRARIELLRAAITLATSRHGTAEHLERLGAELLRLEPTDRRARARLMQLYRKSGRWAELAQLLADGVALLGDAALDERRLLIAEEVRMLDRALGRSDEAAALIEAELVRTPNDEPLLSWLAAHHQRRGDRARYVEARQREVRLLPARRGALVLCHLAETAFEGGRLDEALACYRAARTLDADNRFASEGLKALGRRTRNWRAAAALLPDEGAHELTFAERAERLVERGAAVEASAPATALDWYERAVSVDPDAVVAWDALARVRQALGDEHGAYLAAISALRALWRSTAPDVHQLGAEARRFDALATLATAHGDPAAVLYAERAHDIDATLSAAALVVAQRAYADGRSAEAAAVLSRIVDGQAALAPAQRVDALYRLGVLTARGGALERAIAYFRDGLRIDPLHPGLLHAVADVLTQGKRIAAALQHYTQALLLVSEPRRRAQLYARLGTLWDEQLGMPDEAGACYDLAIAHGTDDSEVMLRALAYYRRSERHEAAARMIDRLLPRASTPASLAALWSERASLLASVDAARAVEAFDMALSYDPGCRAAVEGLAQLLERRGEWQQLVELLEGRLEGSSQTERAACLRRLARIAREQQHDDVGAEIQLRRAAALDPRAEDFDQLLEIIGSDAAREQDRAALLAARLALVGPFVPVLAQIGSQLAAAGERRRAWCVLSPLTMTIIQDPALKSLVLELRKELEKADTLPLLTPQLHRALMPAEVAPPLLDVLAELDELMVVGPTTVEAAGGKRCTRVDVKTPLGRAFAAIAEQLGLPQAILTRADELPVPYRVLDGDVAHVVVRTDVLAPLALGETHALLATLVELSRPGVRMLAALPADEAARLLEALMGAVGRDAREEAAALQQEIVDSAGRERLERWSAQLSGIEDASARTAASLLESARRVGLVAAGELRFAARLASRLDESEAKMPTTGSADDLEKFFAGAAGARLLLAFAVSPTLAGVL